MALTIYDISKKAGVSIATVSRVLNGSDNVRPSTRKKVMDVIEKYDYTPNAFARGMGLHSIHTIGILCADSSDLFLAKAVYYLEQELQAIGRPAIVPAFSGEYLVRMAARACTTANIGCDIFDNMKLSDYNKIRSAARSFLLMSE